MCEDTHYDRRRFLGITAMTIAAAHLGTRDLANAQSRTTPPAALPTIKPGTHTSFGALKQIDAGVLHVGYAEAGPADGPAVILLYSWPYDIYSYVDVAPALAAAGYRVIVPYLRGYGTTRFLSHVTPRNGQQSVLAVDILAVMDALHIEQAILAGYDWGVRTANIITYRRDFAKLIWQFASPRWDFDAATFDRSAAAFDHPDHVSIVIHNYRWRLGLAAGEPQDDALEQRLVRGPAIGVPTITLEGEANGAPHPDASANAKKFSGTYAHRVLTGGIGHNLPQEAPQAFAEAVLEVDGY